MKNKLIKLIATILISFTFTSCSLLSGLSGGDSGGGTGGDPGLVEKKITKLATDRSTLVTNTL